MLLTCTACTIDNPLPQILGFDIFLEEGKSCLHTQGGGGVKDDYLIFEFDDDDDIFRYFPKYNNNESGSDCNDSEEEKDPKGKEKEGSQLLYKFAHEFYPVVKLK